MRTGFVHAAELELDAGADERAPGGAVTVALCGHWEHEGPCRWPHHTAVETRSGSTIRLRTVFVADPGDEQPVRTLIMAALSAGGLDTEMGAGRWRVVSQGPADLDPAETGLAERLAR
ncbi:MAG: hypothetical protein ACRDOO_14805 [Actinomadura sp.]